MMTNRAPAQAQRTSNPATRPAGDTDGRNPRGTTSHGGDDDDDDDDHS